MQPARMPLAVSWRMAACRQARIGGGNAANSAGAVQHADIAPPWRVPSSVLMSVGGEARMLNASKWPVTRSTDDKF